MEPAPGLSSAEAVDRRARGLGNAVRPVTGRTTARILVDNVATVFNAVVGGSFVLLLVLGAWQDALFGFSVLANTALGVVQEIRARRALERLNVLTTPRALVRRDGVTVACAVGDVVLDDLLLLRPGEQLAADAVVVESDGLEADESLLTGEAEPVRAPVGRTLLSGSTVAAGSGIAKVVRVGAASYSARVTEEARRFSMADSELRREIGRVVRWVSIALVPLTLLVVHGQMQAAGGWTTALADGAWRGAAVRAIASVIAMIPAGLVLITSLSLTVGALRLSRSRVLVRELAAVEGLARVDTLCIDKTGTLTDGAIVLDRIEPVPSPPPGWRAALGALARDPSGGATAQAIAAAVEASPALPAPDAVVRFASRHKWSGVGFGAGAAPGSWVLGGADVVLPGRSGIAEPGGARTLVLAHSGRRFPVAHDTHVPVLPHRLELVATLVLRERVRGDAAETMRYFAEQGVEVLVLSGDAPATVNAIARAAGLTGSPDAVDARTLPDEPMALAEACRTGRLFARVTPEQKRAMVLALRSAGRTVAMVGDGVNDTLALKHADLGIAMGSGSAAARAVAHLVLLDGDLARLPGVVAEGRRVIANVERLAKLFLTKTVYAIALAVVFGVLVLPYPFLPRQLSVVDGLTLGLPSIVLALLPNTRVHRPGFLRRAVRFCVPSGLVVAAVVLAVVGSSAGLPQAQVRTAAVAVLTLEGLAVLAVLAPPVTRATAAMTTAACAAGAALVAIPFAREFLQLEAPPPRVLVVVLTLCASGAVLLALIGLAGRRHDERAARATR